MSHILKSYLSFFFNAKNEHGVHSPFVYELITKCFYDSTIYPEYDLLDTYRKTLLRNNNYIEVTDFGAGSRVFKSNHRKISAIAKNAGITPKNGKLLTRLVRYLKPHQILEIGTSVGLATCALSLGNSQSKITTLEGCASTLAAAKSQITALNIKNIQFINTEFSTYLKSSSLQNFIFDFIYFDGNHSKNATLSYFDQLLHTTTASSVWVFDDIHWSKEMEEAWTIIKQHPKVSLTIDTFHWGIVFFRKEQIQKEHFILHTSPNFCSRFFKKIRL